ncbi:MAG: ABC transporter transmembrane domain-containing protein, partial [Steroidobacteraceae bacterium]
MSDPRRATSANVPGMPAMQIYRRLLGYARPHAGMFAIGVLGMVIFAATDAAIAWFVKYFLKDAFVVQNPRAQWLVPAGAIGLFLLRGASDYLLTYFPGWVGRQVIKALRADLFAHYMRLPTAYYDRASGGSMLSRLTYNIEQVAEATTLSVTVLVRDSLTILALVGTMFWFNWQLSVLAMVVAPIIALLMK